MASVRERGVSARFVRTAGHDATFALFIGGRSGSGKSSVAGEIHEQLSSRGVMHACIEGDNLDLAHPPLWGHGLAERNLAAMSRNYRALGYRRLIYTNTVSVLHARELEAALGGEPTITGVLLTADDETIQAFIPPGVIAIASGWLRAGHPPMSV